MARRWRTSHAGPFSAARFLLSCGMAASNIGDRKVGGITQVLRESVVRKQAQAVRIPSANVDVAGIVPTSSCVFQEVHSAHWNRGTGNRDARRKHRPGKKGRGLKWTARLQ